MKKFRFILILICSLLFLSGKGYKQQGFNLKEFEKSLVLIPEGSFLYGLAEYSKWNAELYWNHSDSFSTLPKSRTIHVDSFYMYIHEVSNGEYLTFLTDLKKKDIDLYRAMLQDTLVGRNYINYGEPYVEYYHRHPAYSNYPVVGVTYEQATSYCKWLTEKYMNEEKRKFKRVEFKLPTVGQWTYAAMGGKKFSRFPWRGPSMQDEDGKWLANFHIIEQANIGRSRIPVLNNKGEIENREIFMAKTAGSFSPTPVNSYLPNEYGIYNMAGNAEEFVREKGIIKGGSWYDPGYYLQTWIEERYDSTSSAAEERGFRFVMELLK